MKHRLYAKGISIIDKAPRTQRRDRANEEAKGLFQSSLKLDILKGYQSCNWSQLKDELQPSYTSLIYPAPLLLYSEEIESKHKQDLSSRPKENSSSFSVEPQSQDIPESVSLPSSCYMCGESYHSVCNCHATIFLIALGICYLDINNEVVMVDGSAFPQAGGEGGIACTICEQESKCTAMLVLDSFDSKSFSSCSALNSDYENAAEPAILNSININSAAEHSVESEISFTGSDDELAELLETSPKCLYEDLAPESLISTEPDPSTHYSIYGFMNGINDPESVEEEGVRGPPSTPISSLLLPFSSFSSSFSHHSLSYYCSSPLSLHRFATPAVSAFTPSLFPPPLVPLSILCNPDYIFHLSHSLIYPHVALHHQYLSLPFLLLILSVCLFATYKLVTERSLSELTWVQREVASSSFPPR